MEFWIVLDKSNKIQLPVNPSEFMLTQGTELKSVNINSLGEAVMIGNLNLSTISLSGFFPARRYDFAVVRKPKKPYEYVKKVQEFRKSKKPVTLIITKTTINTKMVIESFEYGERDGTGDVYYTIAFKQYRELKVVKKNTTKKKKKKNNTRSGTAKAVPKTYYASPGACLYKIAKKVYGDKSKYKILIKKNKLRASEKKSKKMETGYLLKC